MNSEEILTQLGGGDWKGALRIIQAELGKSSTRIVATALGVSMREVQRMKAAAGITQATQKRGGANHQARLVGMAAALKLRTVSRVRPGDSVTMVYGSKVQGTRSISAYLGGDGAFNADAAWRDDAAALLDSGNFAGAAELLDGAVMDAYGMVLGEPLSPSDYGDDFGFLE